MGSNGVFLSKHCDIQTYIYDLLVKTKPFTLPDVNYQQCGH